MELTDVQRFVTEALASIPDLDWFLDANVIISGFANELLPPDANMLTTSGVIQEVRRRPKSIAANELVDAIESQNNVVTVEQVLPSVDFLIRCARSMSPAVRVLSEHHGEERAIEIIANNGEIFQCDLKDKLVQVGINTSEETRIERGTRKAWFKYATKRRKRGEHYSFTDEDLVSLAVANSLVNHRRTCILSGDNDCSTILKQLADNILWTASVVDCMISYGKFELNEIVPLWENRCQDLDRFRNAAELRRMGALLESGNPDLELAAPIENEVVLVRPNPSRITHFAFSPPLCEFVADIEFLTKRCDLIRRGFDFPV